MQPQPILHFWFTELTPKHHFAKDAALDEAIRTHFGATLEAAARCELPSHHQPLWPLSSPQRHPGPRVHTRGAGVFE